MKFDVMNRWTGKLQFTAEIECNESNSKSVKLGLSILWGLKNDAKLHDADLRYANLHGANLRYTNLHGANLQSANMRYASLQDADLQDANLQDADLQDAKLHGADLQDAKLHDADLRYANLHGADLHGAKLRHTNLHGANLQDADLHGADLRYAVGNMMEVKSLQFDKWAVTYTHNTMAIGCQSHSIDLWRKSDPRWIAAMDTQATEWWSKFGAIIIALIDASPAIKPEFNI